MMIARRTFVLSALSSLALPALAEDKPVRDPALPWFTRPKSPLEVVLDKAEGLAPLETVLVAHAGQLVSARGYRDHSPENPTNIKSASKTVMSALVGIAIDKGVLEGVDQKVVDLLPDDLPKERDPRLQAVTVGHLLSMQAGLEPTSGAEYSRWILSRNWVRDALGRPFVGEPGGDMLYSTGSTHLLSAILTKASGRSTRALAEDWLGPLDDFVIGGWQRDRQGIYMGGNQMAISPRALLAFGELYRNQGLLPDGTRLLSERWVDASWQVRTHSVHSGDGYGYGWFERAIGGATAHYAWGFGGQMLYVVPQHALTVAMTSDENSPSASNGHLAHLHDLLGEIIGTFAPTGPELDQCQSNCDDMVTI